MSLNMRHGKGLDGKINLDRIASFISTTNADIIGLNEVDKHFSSRSNYENQVHLLATRLGMNYAFGPALTIAEKRQYGNAICSKYPIINQVNNIFRLPLPLAEPRSILDVQLAIDEINLHCSVGHFSIHPFLHRKQVDYCLKKPCDQPTIIMGDLNRSYRSKPYKRMTEKFIDCFSSKDAFTFHAKNPKVRLDYIFITEHFQIRQSEVLQSNISDHLPIVVDLSIEKNTAATSYLVHDHEI